MAEYRYVATDLLSGKILSELPFNVARFGSKLCSYGSFEGLIPLRVGSDVRPMGIDINRLVVERTTHATLPTRTGLYVLRDNTVLWGGMIWASNYRQSTANLEIRGADFWALFRNKRVVESTLRFSQVDQTIIANSLVAHGLNKPGGQLPNFFAWTPPTGVKRDRNYFHYELHYVGELVENLAATIDGFDFNIECTFDNNLGTFSSYFLTYYPKKGRAAVTNDLVFRLDQNIIDMQWPVDGFKSQNTVHGVGAGEGEAMIRSKRQNITSGYPLIEDVFSYKDIKNITTLNEHLDDRLRRSAKNVTVPSVTVRADIEPVIGSYGLGDEVRIVVPERRDPYFWAGLDNSFRITEMSVEIDNLVGKEEVTLSFGDEMEAQAAQIGLPDEET